MKKMLFMIAIIIFIFEELHPKVENKKVFKEKNQKIKLDCSKFFKGKFLDHYDNKKSLIIRDGIYSYFYDDDQTEFKLKSRIEKITECKYKFIRLEYNDANASWIKKKLILNTEPIHEIFKIENDRAYYKGINCDCIGYYQKIE